MSHSTPAQHEATRSGPSPDSATPGTATSGSSTRSPLTSKGQPADHSAGGVSERPGRAHPIDPAIHPAPLFVASDVDGTLLTPMDRVSPRTRAVIQRMVRQGTVFTLASGRPARWLLPVVEQLPVSPVLVCANGAVIFDSAADRILHVHALQPEVIAYVMDVASAAGEAVGGVGFAVERAGRSAFDAEDELFAVEADYDHAWLSDEHCVQSRTELAAAPVVKLLVRHPLLTSSQLFKVIAPHIDPELAHATYSWEGGLVEVSAPGVSKRSALEGLARDLGVSAQESVVFGDMPNDLEMLTWAGLGVAMGNAPADVRAAANYVTADNQHDGVAQVLETWF